MAAPQEPTTSSQPLQRQEEQQQHLNPISQDPYAPPPGSKSISTILAHARSHLTRLTPSQALSKILTPPSPSPSTTTPTTVLVDIRPAAQRAAEGSMSGALIVERNVLEWRFDPQCEARLWFVGRYDMRVVVMCQEGYTSSLAARALQEVGLGNATDVVGGYRAWREEGLPGKVELLLRGDGEDGEGKSRKEGVREDGKEM